MRIAFHGKGGAGKTTTAAGFTKYASTLHPFVLAVDADLNAHLQEALCFSGDARHIGAHFQDITGYLKGRRGDIGDRPMICTLPPAIESNFVRVSPNDPLVQRYALSDGRIALLTVGKYEERDLGTTCYHEKLKPLMSIFHHMLDGEDDVVVVDTIAGTDNISTSLSFAYDLNVFVVEPTEKSLQVYEDYLSLVPQYADSLYVIGNKISDSKDEEFLAKRIKSDVYLGSIPFSKQLKKFEQGNVGAITGFEAEQSPVFSRAYKMLKARKRNWHRYLELLRATYEWDCQRWYSDFYKCDLLAGIDDAFTYEAVLNAAGEREQVLAKR
jgi:CO dehydrogenase maturation factor